MNIYAAVIIAYSAFICNIATATGMVIIDFIAASCYL